MAEHKKKKHGFHRTSIEHHRDASHTVHHQATEGPHKDVKHAAADLNAVHDSMQDNLGVPNPGEAEADAGQHGVPAAMASPAGLPAPAASAPVVGM